MHFAARRGRRGEVIQQQLVVTRTEAAQRELHDSDRNDCCSQKNDDDKDWDGKD
jgi:hypothetical protein